MSDCEQWYEVAPNMINDVEELLEYEMLPLRICIIHKDNKMLNKIWRLHMAWDACHFYRMVELLNEHQDEDSLKKVLTPTDKYVTHFFEPEILQTLENSDMSETFR